MKRSGRKEKHSIESDPDAPVIMLAPEARRRREDVLLEGGLRVITPHGLDANNRLLIEGLRDVPGERILSVALPDPLPTLAAACVRPQAVVECYQLDLFHAGQTSAAARANRLANIHVYCEPLVPHFDPAPDLILQMIRKDAEGGLSLELLRQAHARLAVGGRMLTVTNNPQDKWLRGQLEKIFGTLTLAAKSRHGLLYLTKKISRGPTDEDEVGTTAEGVADAPPATECFIKHVEVALFDETLTFETAYGTFSSDGLDEGSRALLEVLAAGTPEGVTYPELLDLGCGWGALGIIGARRFGGSRAVLLDANARAVWLARRNAAVHADGIIEVRHEAGVESIAEGSEIGRYDLVVANPPYGTEFRVSELFLKAGLYALKPGGRIWLVARHNPVLVRRTEEMYGNVEVHKRRGYEVVSAERRR